MQKGRDSPVLPPEPPLRSARSALSLGRSPLVRPEASPAPGATFPGSRLRPLSSQAAPGYFPRRGPVPSLILCSALTAAALRGTRGAARRRGAPGHGGAESGARTDLYTRALAGLDALGLAGLCRRPLTGLGTRDAGRLDTRTDTPLCSRAPLTGLDPLAQIGLDPRDLTGYAGHF
ncbi:hypothetical protein NDU88_000907 [Pleurodeles waltl]|uniref:Uncharacterized protein n=1 Tax=Pleurodeles waltl TaxID=8319 RepID=A0AAV7KX09_PLEWA|nr:hypothetical protein NDU88_000907 [Pleurodeles waltl]